MLTGRAHLNLIDSSRQLFELDPGTALEATPAWLFGAGSCSHPSISNAAFRIDDGADAAELIERARAFFGARGRGFCLWVRGREPADADLLAAARAAGLQQVYEMPEMILDGPLEEPPLIAGAELGRVTSAEQAEEFWRVAALSYASLGFPPEVFGSYANHAGLWADNIVAFIARLEGRPASIAMTIVSRGVAGIYWVGSLEGARGRGLGRAATAAAVVAGFGLGAEIASLQASPMGESIYAAMGFEPVFDYRLMLSPAP